MAQLDKDGKRQEQTVGYYQNRALRDTVETDGSRSLRLYDKADRQTHLQTFAKKGQAQRLKQRLLHWAAPRVAETPKTDTETLYDQGRVVGFVQQGNGPTQRTHYTEIDGSGNVVEQVTTADLGDGVTQTDRVQHDYVHSDGALPSVVTSERSIQGPHISSDTVRDKAQMYYNANMNLQVAAHTRGSSSKRAIMLADGSMVARFENDKQTSYLGDANNGSVEAIYGTKPVTQQTLPSPLPKDVQVDIGLSVAPIDNSTPGGVSSIQVGAHESIESALRRVLALPTMAAVLKEDLANGYNPGEPVPIEMVLKLLPGALANNKNSFATLARVEESLGSLFPEETAIPKIHYHHHEDSGWLGFAELVAVVAISLLTPELAESLASAMPATFGTWTAISANASVFGANMAAYAVAGSITGAASGLVKPVLEQKGVQWGQIGRQALVGSIGSVANYEINDLALEGMQVGQATSQTIAPVASAASAKAVAVEAEKGSAEKGSGPLYHHQIQRLINLAAWFLLMIQRT